MHSEEEMTPDQILEMIGNSQDRIEFITTPGRAYMVVAYLQTGIKAVERSGDHASTTIARQIAENLIEGICAIIPEARQVIEPGWNRSLDMTASEFEVYRRTGYIPERPHPDEDLIAQCSTRLQQYSQEIGQAVILASNMDMNDEGLKAGNINTVDLEPIGGITFATHCNSVQAQFLINGIQMLLSALPIACPDHLCSGDDN